MDGLGFLLTGAACCGGFKLAWTMLVRVFVLDFDLVRRDLGELLALFVSIGFEVATGVGPYTFDVIRAAGLTPAAIAFLAAAAES